MCIVGTSTVHCIGARHDDLRVGVVNEHVLAEEKSGPSDGARSGI